MNHLLRSQAPVSEAGWQLLDQEARDRLAPALAARKLVDFSGPQGWEHSATNLGRVSPLESPSSEGVSVMKREALALVELRADFELARMIANPKMSSESFVFHTMLPHPRSVIDAAQSLEDED